MEVDKIENDCETQATRAFLREKFLRFIAKISISEDGNGIFFLDGPKCEINMFENITVNGNLKAFDLEFENIAVENLQTPSLPVQKAILRTSDIISIHLKNIPNESFT